MSSYTTLEEFAELVGATLEKDSKRPFWGKLSKGERVGFVCETDTAMRINLRMDESKRKLVANEMLEWAFTAAEAKDE